MDSIDTLKPMKQLKSNSQDIRDMFERSITVRHVVETLKCCQADEDATVVRKRMEKDRFDVLGIAEKDLVYGYVEQSSLKTGSCKQYERKFQASELIAESTPLIDLLPILRDTSRVFVLDRNRVTGIVTRGDLQKAPVRMLVFGLIMLLEMNLLYLVRTLFPADSWQEKLSPDRLKKARTLMKQRQDRNEELDILDCLQFCDKGDILKKHEKARAILGFSSEKGAVKRLKSIEVLRNRLCHAQDLVLSSTWEEVIDVVADAEVLICKCEEFQGEERKGTFPIFPQNRKINN